MNRRLVGDSLKYSFNFSGVNGTISIPDYYLPTAGQVSRNLSHENCFNCRLLCGREDLRKMRSRKSGTEFFIFSYLSASVSLFFVVRLRRVTVSLPKFSTVHLCEGLVVQASSSNRLFLPKSVAHTAPMNILQLNYDYKYDHFYAELNVFFFFPCFVLQNMAGTVAPKSGGKSRQKTVPRVLQRCR